MPKEAPLTAADVGDLDHGSGMARRLEIGEPPLGAADLSLMADDETGGDGEVVERLMVARPLGHVLQALAVSSKKIQIHGRRLVALLDQFDLEVAGIGQRAAHLDL
jgi:hypothetical protein